MSDKNSAPEAMTSSRIHRARRWTMGSLANFWGEMTSFHQAAAIVIVFVFLALAAIVSCLWAAGILGKDNAAIGAAIFAAGVALTTFLVGNLAQDLTRRKEREQSRLDLALALYAEIRSNLLQQRAATAKDGIAAKIERTFNPAASPASATSTTDAGQTGEKPPAAKSLGVADDSNPMFKAAIEDYERIPSGAIIDVVEYYNLDGMLNKLDGIVSSPQFSALNLEQKAQGLKQYWELGNRVDEAGMKAMARLLAFVDRHEMALADAERRDFAARTPAYVFDISHFSDLTNALPKAGGASQGSNPDLKGAE